MRSIGWPVIIIASAIGSGFVTLGNIESPIRPILAFWFLLICPGMAFVRLLRLEGRLTEWAIAIALSLALDTIVAEVMVLTKLWSPRWGLLALVYVSLGGACLQLIRAQGRGFVLRKDRIITSSGNLIFGASLVGFVLGTFLLVRSIGIPAPQRESVVISAIATSSRTPGPSRTFTPTSTPSLQSTPTPVIQSTSTPTDDPTRTPTPAPTNTPTTSAQPPTHTPTPSPAPLASTLSSTAPPGSTSPVFTGTVTLLSPLSLEDPIYGPVDFEWRWSGPLPPDVGFEVRVWEEGRPETGAHDAMLDNVNGNITKDGDTYRLSTDISNALGVQGRTGIYWWTVALVRIIPSYADLGQEAMPEHLRFVASSRRPRG